MNERKTLKINNQNHLEIGGVDTTVLAQKYGTPLYVVDKTYVKEVCRAYSSTLLKEYGNGIISYASKAFCCKDMIRTVNAEGLGIDVVSMGELYTALSVNFPAEKIIFHGNNKTFSELNYAIENNVGLIVVDAYSEANDIDKICLRVGKKQKVLIRVNPGVEAHTHHYIQTAKPDSKFGFSTEGDDAINVIKHVLSFKNLQLEGLHCHIGSQIFEEKSFIIAVDKMIEFYKRVKAETGAEFNVLDVGGGFGIYYTGEDKKMSLEDYKSFISTIIKTLNDRLNIAKIKKPYLILEPGRSIIGEAGITLYTIGRIKEITGLKNYLAIDGGMFDNPRFALYQAKYSVVPAENMNAIKQKTYTLAGKCCESGDVIAEDVLLPEMKEGELVAVLSTGAYNYSMASNYNRNAVPPVVMVEEGKDYLAVKPQTLEDIVRNDV